MFTQSLIVNSFVLGIALWSGLAFAEDGPKPPVISSENAKLIETHEKMAENHKNFVDCLKSGKEVDACRSVAISACPMQGESSCPFGGPMQGKGRGQGGKGVGGKRLQK